MHARASVLQAQDDADLIGKEDRVNNEWIMDAITHQPLGKQAAIKGNDGVFYWDLNVKQSITPGGASVVIAHTDPMCLVHLLYVHASACTVLDILCTQVFCRRRHSSSATCEQASTTGGMACSRKQNE